MPFCPHKDLPFNFMYLFFCPQHAACRILVPRPGIKPAPPAVEARSQLTGLPGNFLITALVVLKPIVRMARPEERPQPRRISFPLGVGSTCWDCANRSICQSPFTYQALKAVAQKWAGGFPGGAVVKNPPANAEDTGSSPGPGRSHMPWSN